VSVNRLVHNSSYYYFGYVLAATLTKLSGFAPAITYNLSLALFFSLGLLSAYGVLRGLVPKRWLALGGAAMVAMAGTLWSVAYIAIQSGRGSNPLAALFSHGFIWDPTSALSRNDLTVQILNGTGIPGVAGVLKDKLEGLGYSAVSTGNADNYDYKKVEISLKTSKAAYFDLLVSDLGVAYTIASSSGTLSTSSQFDAVIILGQQ
jgi:hypothetical protein